TVQDTGIGILEEELEQIFNKFYRSEAVKTIKGTGLGLSITKAIVSGHQGDINVHNVESGGTCFTITLPLHDITLKIDETVDSLLLSREQ
ncbi:MAG: hypothetical protein D3909_16735, partial [Candidatus Electrothrix sp. ATG1]|nr:hypothetical protein [Candidatus Electrothrix sp. ATG1]